VAAALWLLTGALARAEATLQRIVVDDASREPGGAEGILLHRAEFDQLFPPKRFPVSRALEVSPQRDAAAVGKQLRQVDFEVRVGHVHGQERHDARSPRDFGVLGEWRGVVHQPRAKEVERLGLVDQVLLLGHGMHQLSRTNIERIVRVRVECGAARLLIRERTGPKDVVRRSI
jgi:hypothetical protein